ncbi:adhesion G protein-coupled receptor L4 isoform X1 [Cherax quadricarinatus]|uniref:adhesion G protein-coupled receptor L4 isoform X1 n=1 Tax=Cherax quadricarinatus TaxID=27406 RepID=UPI00387E86AC
MRRRQLVLRVILLVYSQVYYPGTTSVLAATSSNKSGMFTKFTSNEGNVPPLIEAVLSRNLTLVETLLRHCPDLTVLDATGLNASARAAQLGYTDLITLIEDQSANCTWCQTKNEELVFQNGQTCSLTLPLAKAGTTIQPICPTSGLITNWTCSSDGQWQHMSSEGAESLQNAAINISGGLMSVQETCGDDLRFCDEYDNNLRSCLEEVNSCTGGVSVCPLNFKSCPGAVNACHRVAENCWKEADQRKAHLVNSTEGSETLSTGSVESVNQTMVEEQVSENHKTLKKKLLNIFQSLFSGRTGSETLSTGSVESVNQTMVEEQVSENHKTLKKNLLNILKSLFSGRTDLETLCGNYTAEERRVCQETQQENISRELELLGKNLTQTINQAGTRKEKRTFAEEYLNVTLRVLDNWNSTQLKGQEKTALALISSSIQEKILSASLLLASVLSNSSIHFTTHSTDSSISRQNPVFFTPEKLIQKSKFSNSTNLQLPPSFYVNYTDDEDMVVLVVTSFRNLHCITNSIPCEPDDGTDDVRGRGQVNSIIIGATVGQETSWRVGAGEGVKTRLGHVYKGDKYQLGPATCVWWDIKNNNWSSDGCRLINQTKQYTDCMCNHLTNLAVIMDINGFLDEFSAPLRIISAVGCTLSIICLILAIICLSISIRSKKRQRESGVSTIHRHLCVCLLMAEVVLMLGLDAVYNNIACTLVALLLHYFFLATFTWCAIEAFNLYLMLGKVFQTFNTVKYYVVVGYGFPFLLVSITLFATQGRGYGTQTACWLESGRLIWTFAGPLLIILLGNLVSFTFAMRVAWKSGRTDEQRRRGRCTRLLPVKLRGSLSILLILGLTWFTGFTYLTEATQGGAFLFTVLNSLQGVAIFLTTVIMNEKLMQDIGDLPFITMLQNLISKRKPRRDEQHETQSSVMENTLAVSQ